MVKSQTWFVALVAVAAGVTCGCQSAALRPLGHQDSMPASQKLQSETVTARAQTGDVASEKLARSADTNITEFDRPIQLPNRDSNPVVGDVARPLSVSAFSGTLTGFRVGWEFTKEFGIEWNSAFGGSVAEGGFRSVDDLDVLWYPFQQAEGSNLRSYVLAGLGFEVDSALIRTGGVAPIGAGVKWSLSDWGQLRLDLRHYLHFSDPTPLPGLDRKDHSIEATAGFDITF